jgi:hypothetical protein
MKIEEAYLRFVNQVNRNLTNNNINVDKPRFILLFNDISNRYLSWILEKRNEDVIRYVAPLLVLDKALVKVATEQRHEDFELPKDYFDLSNLTVFASSKNCGLVQLKTWEIKNEDLEEKYYDEFNSPSVEWAETFYTTASNKIAVYKKDFSIDKANLSYYRYPKQVDISGYIHMDGSPSQSIDPEFDDKVVNKILIAMSKEFAAINEDTQRYQVDSNRLFSEI